MTVLVKFATRIQGEIGAPEMTVEADTFKQLIAGVCAKTRLTPAMFAWKNRRPQGLVIMAGRSVICDRYGRQIANILKPGEVVHVMASM